MCASLSLSARRCSILSVLTSSFQPSWQVPELGSDRQSPRPSSCHVLAHHRRIATFLIIAPYKYSYLLTYLPSLLLLYMLGTSSRWNFELLSTDCFTKLFFRLLLLLFPFYDIVPTFRHKSKYWSKIVIFIARCCA